MTIQASRGPVARPVSDEARDDAVVPFAVEPLDVRGRVVRLGATIDHILAKHGYPTPVARLVGEACVLTVLLATSLKIEGRFQLQTRGDGAIGMLVVDFGLTLATPPADAAWIEAEALLATIEDHELVDPALSSERLLYRLFHEQGVTVFPAQDVRDACRCSNERIEAMLRRFTPLERRDMTGDDGLIGVTCEFCSTYRAFDPADFEA